MERLCCICENESTSSDQTIGDIYIFSKPFFGFEPGVYECYNAPFMFDDGFSVFFYEDSLQKVADWSGEETGHVCCDCGAELSPAYQYVQKMLKLSR